MNGLSAGGTWGRSDLPPGGPMNGGRPPPSRAEAIRGVCFCLLYDLCCWLASVRRPVPADVDEYILTTLRDVGDARQRLGRYVSPAVLESWERALQPFFAGGLTLEPELGESGSFQDRGRDASGRIQAELRFGNRSSVLDRSQRRHQLPPHDWTLRVWLSADSGGYVENASIRRA